MLCAESRTVKNAVAGKEAMKMIKKRLQKNIAVMLIGIMSYGGGSVVFAYDDIAVRAAVAADEADEVHMPAHPEEAMPPDEADEVHMPAHPEESVHAEKADDVYMPLSYSYNGGDMITLARRDRDRRGDRGFHRDRSRRGGYSQGSVNTAAIAGAVIGAIIAKNT